MPEFYKNAKAVDEYVKNKADVVAKIIVVVKNRQIRVHVVF